MTAPSGSGASPGTRSDTVQSRGVGSPADIVEVRVLHDGARPIHDTGESYRFGLQRGAADVQAGAVLADGRLAFDVALRVKPGPDPERPVFMGEFTDGPPAARFLRLGWKPDRPGWINRVKVPLSGITWVQVREAQAAGLRLCADATGAQPHQPRPLVWTLAAGRSEGVSMTATSGSGKSLPARPSEEHLRKQAKRLARSKGLPVAKAQRQLARDYGFPSWPRMLTQVRGQVAAAAESPLIEAARAGDLAQTERLIAAGESLDGVLWHICDSDAPTSARLAVAERLLEAGANPRTGTEYDRVPLHAAAGRGPWSMVDLLIRRGASYLQDDSRGRTALDYARQGSAPDKATIAHRLARPVIDDPDFAAAVAAIHADDLAGLKALLDAHPDLLKRRAKEPDCYPRDFFRDPKLFWFVANNPELTSEVPASIAGIAAEMIRRGIDKPDLDYTLELAMSGNPAPWRGRRAAMLRVLLEAGATPTERATLVTLAYAQREPIRLMLRRGLDLSAPIAAGLGQTDALPRLLADASQADKQAALSMAVVNGQYEAARLCLVAGADPNARMAVHKHCTPAHSAVNEDDTAMLKLLVENGARLDVADDLWNATPSGWARFLKKTKSQAFLASLDAV